MPIQSNSLSSTAKALPKFVLPDVFGQEYRSTELADEKILVVLFICAHCPYVQAIEGRFIALAASYIVRPVQFIGICSNDSTTYPADAPHMLAARALELNYPFPYLHDESQSVAKLFDAACTPECYVYDFSQHLVYHGRIDDNWKNELAVQSQDLKAAIDRVLDGKEPLEPQYPAIGCAIKWK
jgi:peroxiredoxin